MTSMQYRRALKKTGLSIRGAGPFFGFSSRQSQRFASGASEVPEAVAKLLAIMVACRWDAEYAAKLAAGYSAPVISPPPL